MPAAEIITIGTELLLGETVDTNTRFIARTLRSLGVDLYRTQTVGDNAGRIAKAVREALQRTDIVITTGGLGPTIDDPTRQAIADATARPLIFHPELWEQINERIARYGRTPTENQKRQAYIPENAIVIENPVGTAPAFIIEISSHKGDPTRDDSDVKVVITLPGVPKEMETLLTDTVVPFLQNRFNLDAVIRVRTLHVSGIGEGVLDEKVGDLEELVNPTVGLTAHSGVVDIRIASKARSAVEGDQMNSRIEEDIRARLGNSIFGADDDTLEDVTLNAIGRHGWSLSTLECGLDGALSARLNRSANPAYTGGSSIQIEPAGLAAACEAIHARNDTSLVVGVVLVHETESYEVTLYCSSPLGKVEHKTHYGGHPGNAARWAVNSSLDWLRHIIQQDGV